MDSEKFMCVLSTSLFLLTITFIYDTLTVMGPTQFQTQPFIDVHIKRVSQDYVDLGLDGILVSVPSISVSVHGLSKLFDRTQSNSPFRFSPGRLNTNHNAHA